jgi:hypothetical protein
LERKESEQASDWNRVLAPLLISSGQEFGTCFACQNHMKEVSQSSPCIRGCRALVPPQLIAERLCVLHFTLSVERTCAETHRQIALGGGTAERRAEAAVYIDASALILARLTSSLCLSDVLKRRILSTFLSLMNLRENLERATNDEAKSRVQNSSTASARAAVI